MGCNTLVLHNLSPKLAAANAPDFDAPDRYGAILSGPGRFSLRIHSVHVLQLTGSVLDNTVHPEYGNLSAIFSA